MNRKFLLPTALLAGGLILTGCTTVPAEPGEKPSAAATAQASTESVEPVLTGDLTPAEVMAENADYTTFNTDEWDESDAIDVTLSGTTATVAGETGGVTANGSTVSITAAGVYRLTGTFEGGIVVAAPDDAEVVLLLDGVTVANASGAAIDVQSADNVAIHLAKGSSNTVSDAASYTADADANAAISAASDLTISGSGSLEVTGKGGHGIKSTDDLVILDGTLEVTAAEDALRGKDALVVEGGALTLRATSGDGMKSKGNDGETDASAIDWTQGYTYVSGGSVDIEAGDDGIQSFTDTVLTGGTVTVAAADDGVKAEAIVSIGESSGIPAPTVTVTTSNEGIEAANIGIGGGVVSVTATDDGLNASGNAELQARIDGTEATADGADEFGNSGERLEIAGGTVTVDAEGDGLDSNGDLTISGGATVVYGPTRGGNGSLDANGELTISGGTVTTYGPNSMEQTPSAGDAGWVLVPAALAAGQQAQLVDESGAVVAELSAKKAAANIIFASTTVSAGATYTVVAGGETLGTAVAGEGGMGGGPGGMGGPGEMGSGGPGEAGGMPGGGEPPARPGEDS